MLAIFVHMQSDRYALLTYQANPQYNVGDYIQSLAAAQFLPHIDKYLCREQLHSYDGEPVKLFMNGWFMHEPSHWPPSTQIHPLLISFHLNSQARRQLLSEKGSAWFRQHAPVGCRDNYTLHSLKEAGIDAYLSGCLTTTFTNTHVQRTNDVYFTDVLFRAPGLREVAGSPRLLFRSIFSGHILNTSRKQQLLAELFDKELLRDATFLQHYQAATHTDKERFAMAASYLEKYATARLVVTSRIHCALPCLAFGTPVIFVDAGFKNEYDRVRLEGVTDLFNTIRIDERGNIDANFPLDGKITADFSLPNPSTHMKYVDKLRETCHSFINTVPLPV